eukprot:Seg1590.6 transcript_id=Seg1590.6/GoldUCD/mRNA.D3Y31 product="hypothetical protein" protein_id=Seg1590.6/GoldUCD/D3Y31
MNSCTEEISTETRQAATCAANLASKGEINWAMSITTNPSALTIDTDELPLSSPFTISSDDLRRAQENDSVINRVLSYVKNGKKPTTKELSSEQPSSKRRRTRLSTRENSRSTDENSEISSEEEDIVLLPNRLPSTEAEIDVENNIPMIAENEIPPNENAELLEDEQPENRVEEHPIENRESAPLTPSLPNIPENVVNEESLISDATEEPIVYSERPVRLRQVPNRLSYYAPGQAYSVQASPLNTVYNRPFINNHPILVRVPLNNPVMTQFVHPPMPFITPSCRQPIQNFVPQQFVIQRPIYI